MYSYPFKLSMQYPAELQVFVLLSSAGVSKRAEDNCQGRLVQASPVSGEWLSSSMAIMLSS